MQAVHADRQRNTTHPQTINVVTYRNNLNKILLTPLSPRDGWTVDACRMVRGSRG